MSSDVNFTNAGTAASAVAVPLRWGWGSTRAKFKAIKNRIARSDDCEQDKARFNILSALPRRIDEAEAVRGTNVEAVADALLCEPVPYRYVGMS